MTDKRHIESEKMTDKLANKPEYQGGRSKFIRAPQYRKPAPHQKLEGVSETPNPHYQDTKKRYSPEGSRD
ncbi:MAG: hypothetical protein K6L75_02390 [Cellvibrionaceae bacterium]